MAENAYVPGFEYDIFISYAHVDNVPGDSTGWVSQFHQELERRIALRVGRLGRVRIWRDPRMDGSQSIDQVLENRITASAVFVALTSTGYLASDYCKNELLLFHRLALRSAYGLQIGERRRLLNVMLTNLPQNKWPEELRGSTGFPIHDAADDAEQFGEPLKPRIDAFETSVRRIADATYKLLEDFRNKLDVSRPAVSGGAIYLADTADSLQELRGRVAADLRQQGRQVITDIPPPYELAGHDARVRSAIATASLAVHLVDSLSGRPVQGEPGTTYPRRQLDIVYATTTPQMIWAPLTLDIPAISSQSHRELLLSLERGSRPEKPYDFVREPEARLSSVILERVQQLDARAVTKPSDASVLLETHLKDQRVAFEMGAWLVDSGVQPFIHQEADDPASGISAFESQLQRSRSVVIFFGRVAKSWVEERLKCVFQFAARQLVSGVRPTLEACYVYLLPPVKESFSLSTGIFKTEILDNTASNRFEPHAAAPILGVRGGTRLP